MHIAKLTILLSAAHFILVIIVFLCFGLGLEGKASFGHLILWALLMPAAYFPLSSLIFIPLNSILWGFCGALLLKALGYFIHK